MSSEAIESLLAQASRLYNEGSYRQAIQKWQEVLALEPGNQKAKESIKIAALLSDTWAEQGAAGPEAAEAEPPGEDQQRFQEGLARARERIAARDFQGALQECEALAAIDPGAAEIKALADQARSGLESEPFIRVALERAARELKAGNFETVEVLCRKVLSLDAGNRKARTFLYMAQRRTAGEPEGEPAPEAEGGAPDLAASPGEAEPAGEEGGLELPPDLEAGGATADPLAALGADLGADLSTSDLGAGLAEGGAETGFPPSGEQPAAGFAPAAAFERGEEVDASQLEAIPLGAPRPSAPHTHKGAELIQEGSIYEGPDPDADTNKVPAPLAAGEEALPPLETGDFVPPAAPAETPPAAPQERRSADDADSGSRPRPAARPRPAPRPPAAAPRSTARQSGGRLGRAVAGLLLKILLAGIGVGLWILREEIKARLWPSAPPPITDTEKETKPRTDILPAGSPGGEAAEAQAPGDAGSAPASAVGAPPEAVPPPVGDAGAPAPGDAAAAGAPAPEPAEARVTAPEEKPGIPEDPAARQEIAQRKFAQARQRIREGRLRDAQALLSSALELDPVLFEARDLLDKVERQVQEEQRFDEDVATVVRSFQGGDYHSALWKLYRLQDAFPSVRAWEPNIAACWYNWGVKLMKAGNCREAIEKFNEVLGINAEDREAARQRTVSERYLSRAKDAPFYAYVDALNLRPLLPMRRK